MAGNPYRRSRMILTLIGVSQVAVIICVLIFLYNINVGDATDHMVLNEQMLLVNSSLIGFLGSLLYFSRKTYTYMISNKFSEILDKI